MLKTKNLYIILSFLVLIACKNEAVDSKNNHAAYDKAWNNLVSANNDISFDSDIHLSESEVILDKNLSDLRDSFIESMNQNQQSVFNKSFYELRPAIDTSKLYKIFSLMPKGGLLHSHSGGITDAKWIIAHAKEYDECYVYTHKDNASFTYGQLGIFQKDQVPKGFVSLSGKIKSNPGFEDELYKLLILERLTISGHMDIWGEFEKRFDRINHLLSYRPFFKEYYKKAFLDMLDDNIQHLEIRFIFGDLYDLEGNKYYNETIIKDLRDALMEVQKVDPMFTLKLIYSSFKFFDNESVGKEIEKAFQLKQLHPDLITGFDLVAEEDALNSLSYYRDNWLQLDSLEKVYGFELPLFLHAGESNSKNNKNLFDIPLLNNYRIGHGLNLVLFPELIKEIKEKDNLVEINPLSNQILGYVNDLRNHPGKILLRHGVQCSISSDDPGVFGYEGLGYDFWSVFMAWELDLSALKKLVFNSIQYSTLTEGEKQIALNELNKRWDTFIDQSNKLFE
ncbi:MAG TPA: adenosine kinase [Bacteroidales bacterium]|jgi:adenosine deaminase CECR1|nr:adenosine kinase [Bacteroidales bacterium]